MSWKKDKWAKIKTQVYKVITLYRSFSVNTYSWIKHILFQMLNIIEQPSYAGRVLSIGVSGVNEVDIVATTWILLTDGKKNILIECNTNVFSYNCKKSYIEKDQDA